VLIQIKVEVSKSKRIRGAVAIADEPLMFEQRFSLLKMWRLGCRRLWGPRYVSSASAGSTLPQHELSKYSRVGSSPVVTGGFGGLIPPIWKTIS